MKTAKPAPQDNIKDIAVISFKLDSFKTVSQRSAVEILDFLGDIGGF
jgi:hypothetical protein